MVGGIFLSEGIQKFLYPDEVGGGRFTKIGFALGDVLGPVVGTTEVVCGILILLGLFARYAILPPLVIIGMAIISTKIPILLGYDVFGFVVKPLPRYGLLSMLHEARTDLCMVCGLLYLSLVGPGDLSLDLRQHDDIQ